MNLVRCIGSHPFFFFFFVGDASIVKVPRRFETVVMKEGQKETLLKGKANKNKVRTELGQLFLNDITSYCRHQVLPFSR